MILKVHKIDISICSFWGTATPYLPLLQDYATQVRTYVYMYICIYLPCGDSVILLVPVTTEEDTNDGDFIALLTPVVTGPNEDTVVACCTV